MGHPHHPQDDQTIVVRTQTWVVATLIALAIAVFALSITVLILVMGRAQ